MSLYKKIFILLVLSICLSLLNIDVCAQELTTGHLEDTVFRIESQLDSLRSERLKILNRAQIVAQRINMYQTAQELNRKQHQNLQKQLQQSQILEESIREIEAAIENKVQQQIKYIKVLVQTYQSDIENKMKILDREKDNLVVKNQLTAELQQLFIKKKQWEERLEGPKLTKYQTFTIESKPWDTSQDLILKSDLLLDREEEIREEINTIEDWLITLRKEESLKRKAEELALETHLFAEREELLFGNNVSGSNREESNILNYDTERLDNKIFGEASQEPSSENWSPDFEGQSLLKESENGLKFHSLETLQESIKLLETHRKKLELLADSLNQCAYWFKKEAESK